MTVHDLGTFTISTKILDAGELSNAIEQSISSITELRLNQKTILDKCDVSSDYVRTDIEPTLCAYLYEDGRIFTNGTDRVKAILNIPVVQGERISAAGACIFNTRALGFFDVNDNVISTYPTAKGSLPYTRFDEIVTVPEHAVRAVVSFYGDDTHTGEPGFSHTANRKTYERLASDQALMSEKIRDLSGAVQGFDGMLYSENTKQVDYSDSMTIDSANYGYLNGRGAVVPAKPSERYRYSDVIDLLHVKQIMYSSRGNWGNCLYAIYDADMNFLCGKTSGSDLTVKKEKIDLGEILRSYPGARFARFGTMDCRFPLSEIYTDECMPMSEYLSASDYLYGKKWVACGDSFTRGGAVNAPYDNFMSAYNTYPAMIAKRHNMNLVMAAVDGGVMYDGTGRLLSDETLSVRVFVKNYEHLSTEISTADYMTISYGLNDTYASNAEISDKTSTNLSTVWGSYNTVLSSVLTWNPNIKIALIVPDGWIKSRIRDEQIKIAEWWGIPCLDLYNDPKNSTLILNSPYGVPDRINPFVIQQRIKAFTSDSSNSHPTTGGHQFRSTIIENFMRSL